MKRFTYSKRMQRLPKQFFADLVRKVQVAQEKGMDVINLGQGNPDQPTPDHIIQSLQQAATNPINHKYPPFRGFRNVKQAVANFYKRNYDVTLDPEREVAILFGGKGGLVELPQIFTEAGDSVLVPDPGYPDYWSGIALSGAGMVTMPLLEKNKFLPDYSLLSEEQLHHAKMMLLNYPNNPTGATATSEFFEETVNLAKQYDINIIHDFAYGAIGFDGKLPTSFLQTEGAKDVGIEIYTMSKSFNMAGWRIAFAVGNEEVIEAINLYQDHMYCSVFGAVQEAAITALDEANDSIPELVSLYERRRNVWVNALREIGWQVEPCEGSFFVWLPVPEGMSSVEFADELIEKVGVVTAPGLGFGEHGEGYIRTALLVDEERLKEAAQRIATISYFQGSN
ncbi:pyridoxal phosphate-dependent aminotransferase [Bacillus solimangrovi]|uniref:LL-diaminopimelate aminotransferase n=1 Tax=Bacillus solimangrovi TaxID=1305675 RepID=A0A1E5LCK5_9BACI|nr:pyridoxal phosphate-dependent aminotransferase [Bacillus solimangrovi]OEH91759.1 LL-diaminopimelate aminotransferase [Bacillus solimangrovi]